MKVRVSVMYKSGVLDPQGRAIMASLHQLGHKDITDVRAGKVVELTLPKMTKEKLERKVRELCEKLLVNAVIEDYHYEVVE